MSPTIKLGAPRSEWRNPVERVRARRVPGARAAQPPPLRGPDFCAHSLWTEAMGLIARSSPPKHLPFLQRRSSVPAGRTFQAYLAHRVKGCHLSGCASVSWFAKRAEAVAAQVSLRRETTPSRPASPRPRANLARTHARSRSTAILRRLQFRARSPHLRVNAGAGATGREEPAEDPRIRVLP